MQRPWSRHKISIWMAIKEARVTRALIGRSEERVIGDIREFV